METRQLRQKPYRWSGTGFDTVRQCPEEGEIAETSAITFREYIITLRRFQKRTVLAVDQRRHSLQKMGFWEGILV
ncbi:hypothetical protein KIN20_027907 [Parelaphostrongylus tenuis]|uniref:Uncharacterized protein n=1 Tax=Parelaphostrongylus tenuis TaxID=148309 RepID=A0AAD5QZZ1_PARTN|nr:hypothetical protein KIN20_027907 [Parelaphostrongylus tenuis]